MGDFLECKLFKVLTCLPFGWLQNQLNFASDYIERFSHLSEPRIVNLDFAELIAVRPLALTTIIAS